MLFQHIGSDVGRAHIFLSQAFWSIGNYGTRGKLLDWTYLQSWDQECKISIVNIMTENVIFLSSPHHIKEQNQI